MTGRPADGETPREIRSQDVSKQEAQREDVRLFVIFLDDYHVRRGASMAVREPLTRFVRNSLGPMDLVGITYPLTPFSDIAFTRNHESVIRAIEQFDGRKYDYQSRKPDRGAVCQLSGRDGRAHPQSGEPVGDQGLISAGLGTLREGRKSMILVSEGYINYRPAAAPRPVGCLSRRRQPESPQPDGRRERHE